MLRPILITCDCSNNSELLKNLTLSLQFYETKFKLNELSWIIFSELTPDQIIKPLLQHVIPPENLYAFTLTGANSHVVEYNDQKGLNNFLGNYLILKNANPNEN